MSQVNSAPVKAQRLVMAMSSTMDYCNVLVGYVYIWPVTHETTEASVDVMWKATSCVGCTCAVCALFGQ